MKIKYIITSIIITLLCFGTYFLINSKYLQKNKYEITDELTYAVIQRDFDNSFILNISGVDATQVSDLASAINDLDKDTRMDAEFRLYFFKGKTDLVKTKAEAIAKIKEYKINLMDGSFNRDHILEVMRLIDNKFSEAAKKYAKEHKDMSLTDASIGFAMFLPRIDLTIWAEDTPPGIIFAAKNIAISRFDNLKVYEQIAKCYQKKQDTQTSDIDIQTIFICAEKYENEVTKEIDKIIKELMVYKDRFINLGRSPEQEKRDKKIFEFYRQFEGHWEVDGINNLTSLFNKDVNITVVNTRPGSISLKALMIYSDNKKALSCFRYKEDSELMICSQIMLNKGTISNEDRLDLISDNYIDDEPYIIWLKRDGKKLHLEGSPAPEINFYQNKTSCILKPLCELRQN